MLIQKPTIDASLASMIGAPVIIQHQDITEKNADELRCGAISDAYFNDMDGWYYCEGVIWDKKAQKLIDKGWSVSCSYDFLGYNDEGGVENNIKYDKEFTKLNFTHLAIVDNPRYERANIVFNSKNSDGENGRWVTIKGTHVFIPDGKSLDDVMEAKGWTKGHKDFSKTMGQLKDLADKHNGVGKKEEKTEAKSTSDEAEGNMKSYKEVREQAEKQLEYVNDKIEAERKGHKRPDKLAELSGQKRYLEGAIDYYKKNEVEGKQKDAEMSDNDKKHLDKVEKLNDFMMDAGQAWVFDGKSRKKLEDILGRYVSTDEIWDTFGSYTNFDIRSGRDDGKDYDEYDAIQEAADRLLSHDGSKYFQMHDDVDKVLDRHYMDDFLIDDTLNELSDALGVEITADEYSEIRGKHGLDSFSITDMREDLRKFAKEKQNRPREIDVQTLDREYPNLKGYGVSGPKIDKLAKKYGFEPEPHSYEGSYSHYDDKNDRVYYAMVGETGDGNYVLYYEKGDISEYSGEEENKVFIVSSPEEGFKHAQKLMKEAKSGKKSNKTNNEKEQDMAIIRELKKLIRRVENEKEEQKMDEKEKIDNENVDKRKLIDEVGGILKGKVDEEVWRTVIGKLEKLSYDKSEAGSADNKKVKNEDDDKEVDNEDEKDKKEVEEVKEDVKEDVENKCKNSKFSFNKINEIYNSVKQVKAENKYVSRQDKLDSAVEYFK